MAKRKRSTVCGAWLGNGRKCQRRVKKSSQQQPCYQHRVSNNSSPQPSSFSPDMHRMLELTEDVWCNDRIPWGLRESHEEVNRLRKDLKQILSTTDDRAFLAQMAESLLERDEAIMYVDFPEDVPLNDFLNRIASNPYTDRKTLNILASSGRGACAYKAARNPAANPGLLKQLAKNYPQRVFMNPSAPLRLRTQIAANHMDCMIELCSWDDPPLKAIRRILQDNPQEAYWKKIAQVDQAHPDVLELLAHSGTEIERVSERDTVWCSLAYNPNTPIRALGHILDTAQNEHPALQMAKRLDLPKDIRQRLVDHEHWTVRHAAATLLHLTEPQMRQIAESSRDDPTKTTEIWSALALRDDLPPDLFDVFLAEGDTYVLYALAGNNNAPSSILSELSRHDHRDVQGQVAAHPNTPADDLRHIFNQLSAVDSGKLNNNQTYFVHKCLCRNSSTPEDMLEIYSRDHDPFWRQELLKNDALPSSLLATLAFDSDPAVARIAADKLVERRQTSQSGI